METEITKRIEALLKRELPEATIDITQDEDAGIIGGRVIWRGFEGYTKLQRQNRIFGLLRRDMTTSEAREIGYIFTYTPSEYELANAA